MLSIMDTISVLRSRNGISKKGELSLTKEQIFKKIKKGIIVSCQALKHEPFYGSELMARMAIAASIGGAVGIRANTPQDIAAIRNAVDLPIIGLKKIKYPDSDAYITPTLKDVEEVINAGADIVAIDCTKSLKPGGKKNAEFIAEIRKNFDTIILADISTYQEGREAEELGVDMIATTLSGYTSYSPQIDTVDFDLIEKLAKDTSVPILAEGRIWRPEEAVKALNLGAYAVVIGTAITRPQEITKYFVEHVKENVLFS